MHRDLRQATAIVVKNNTRDYWNSFEKQHEEAADKYCDFIIFKKWLKIYFPFEFFAEVVIIFRRKGNCENFAVASFVSWDRQLY